MITKSAENKNKFALNLTFTDSARAAWGHILASTTGQSPLMVLLPSYIGFTEREGSGVFDPVREFSAEYRFYKVDGSLRIDMADFSHALQSGGIDIALVIHYFGFCRNDMDKIVELCAEHDVLLVEDCAHAFQLEGAQKKLGNYGAYSFYSLHKYFAVDSGGILKINHENKALPLLPDSRKISQDALEQYAKTISADVASVRRNNFLSYQKFLPKIEEIEIMFNLLDDDIPQSFPIKIKHGLREKLYFHLVNSGIPVTALYYRLIDEIDEEKFPISFGVSNEIINLPLHQDIDESDVRRICFSINDFFN